MIWGDVPLKRSRSRRDILLMPDALAKKTEAKPENALADPPREPDPPAPSAPQQPWQQESAIVPAQEPRREGQMAVAWGQLKDEKAFAVGDKEFTLQESVEMARDFGYYLHGTASLMKHIQRFTGMGSEPERPKKRCLQCDHQNDFDSVFCAGCGERLPKVVAADFRVMPSEIAVQEVRRDAR